MNNFNDIVLKKWRTYIDDITTDSLWLSGNKKNKDGKFIIPKRDFLPKPSNKFHGLFIAEIPYQFINRFTKKGELVYDCFAGSGTTQKVCNILKRECISIDLNPQVDLELEIIEGNAKTYILPKKAQLIFMHPPYHNIVQYSKKEEDLSNCKNLEIFLKEFNELSSNVCKQLDNNRFLILVCGNIYMNGEEQTLGVWLKDIIIKKGFKLKSHIIKDYGETKGGNKNYNLSYYRQLKGNYNNFYGDNIFILQKNDGE